MMESNQMESTVSSNRAEYLPILTVTTVAPLSELYKMTHEERGKVYIFNHENFAQPDSPLTWVLSYFGLRKEPRLPARAGTANDVERLKGVLSTLGFEVIVFNDSTTEEVKNELRKLAGEDHSNRDCLIVIVLSHGDNGIIYSHDGEYKVEELWKNFTSDKCPSLAGKPKLFFIQACRGDDYDTGTEMLYYHTTDSNPDPQSSEDAPAPVHFMIPNQADFLIAFATTPGHVSWRTIQPLPNSPHQVGTWFIQELCKVLEEHGKNNELLWMLTKVCREVAVTRGTENRKKQIPCIVSQLTRSVYFPPKRSLNSSNQVNQ